MSLLFLFSRWAISEDKPRWGDKTPHYVRHIPTLVNIFPNAQVLHIIRDPRAKLEISSYMEVRYGQLLENPTETMETVFRFLGESIPSNSGMLKQPS